MAQTEKFYFKGEEKGHIKEWMDLIKKKNKTKQRKHHLLQLHVGNLGPKMKLCKFQ